MATIAAAGALAASAAAAWPAGAAAARSPLPAFTSCSDLVRFARAGAHRTGGEPGVPPRALPAAPAALTTPRPAPATSGAEGGAPVPGAAPTTTTADAGTPFSTTNDQETGVDEPDLVKTDGRFVYAVTDRTLRIVDVSATQPVVVSSLPLAGYGHELLLRGDTLLVLADAEGYGFPAPGGGPIATLVAPMPGRGRTVVTEIGVGDRAHPAVRRTLTIDGDLVGARQNGGTARIVVDSAPDRITPQDGESVDDAIDETHSTDYLGGTVLRSRVSGRTFRRPLVRCTQVRRPRAFSGLDVLTIMTVDLDKGLYSLDRDGVMAGAQVVYGSDRSLYVASTRLAAEPGDDGPVPQGVRTEIHRFDVTDPQRTTYRASGTVPGYVLNQYAFSEQGGDLRVATTEDPTWRADGAADRPQNSGVSVLRQDGGQLAQIGRLGGLGAGERIYAVRFVGDRGYLVTFRQVDPLFVVDLADPRAPRLRGTLEIPGYSAYLHPVGEHRLLGIGQDLDASGRAGGQAQASLFDVSDPAAPRRVSRLVFGAGTFAAEHDPHAFLWWGPARTAVLPLRTYDSPTFTGAVGVRAGDALTELGRVSHPAPEGMPVPEVSRALVIGERLLTLSYAGLAESRLGDLGVIGFTPFPASTT